MGAAPVLIMLAALGVDYGWQPDGTTSPAGDNIEYIVQISPDQLNQVGSIGEITSAIDPSVQGRVSRIVVRIGDGRLPRNAGRENQLASRTTQVDDEKTVPIPQIINGVAVTSVAGRSPSPGTNAAMMKPDPQTGGFTIPDNMQTGTQSAFDQVRGGLSQTIDSLGAQARSAVDNMTNPSMTGQPQLGNRDDRWDDLTKRPPVTNAGPPSTDPVGADARLAPWGSLGGNPGISPSSTLAPPPLATSPNLAPPANDPRSLAPPSAVNPRSPNDPGWSGYGTNSNFGSLPGGLSIPKSQPNSNPPPNTAVDPRFAGTQPNNQRTQSEYRQDASGNWYDSRGQMVNTDGQPIDRFGNRLGPDGLAYDALGRQVDEYDRPVPDPRFASTSNPGSTAADRDFAQQQTAARLAESEREVRRLQDRETARTRLTNFEDEAASPSDLTTSAAQRAAKAAAERNARNDGDIDRPRRVEAQPFFNFMLFISLIGNGYLIFETNNLRRKFRNMISSVRSSKVSVQPAT